MRPFPGSRPPARSRYFRSGIGRAGQKGKLEEMAESKSENVVWHHTSVNRDARIRISGQKSAVLWFTGLSGSGKSTIANALELRLNQAGKLSYLLDGDNVRHGLCSDL